MIRPPRLADSAPDGEDRYANLLWFRGRKCLPRTGAATPFTIFEPDVRAVGLRDAGRLVTGLVRRELDRERLPQDTSGRLDPGQVAPAKTADRSVLGCMTDMAFPCERATDRSGGLAGTHIGDLNRALRRNISRPRGYAPPVEPTAQRAAREGLKDATSRYAGTPGI